MESSVVVFCILREESLTPYSFKKQCLGSFFVILSIRMAFSSAKNTGNTAYNFGRNGKIA